MATRLTTFFLAVALVVLVTAAVSTSLLLSAYAMAPIVDQQRLDRGTPLTLGIRLQAGGSAMNITSPPRASPFPPLPPERLLSVNATAPALGRHRFEYGATLTVGMGLQAGGFVANTISPPGASPSPPQPPERLGKKLAPTPAPVPDTPRVSAPDPEPASAPDPDPDRAQDPDSPDGDGDPEGDPDPGQDPDNPDGGGDPEDDPDPGQNPNNPGGGGGGDPDPDPDPDPEGDPDPNGPEPMRGAGWNPWSIVKALLKTGDKACKQWSKVKEKKSRDRWECKMRQKTKELDRREKKLKKRAAAPVLVCWI